MALRGLGRPLEAGLMMVKAQRSVDAAECFVAAGDWQRLMPLLAGFDAETQTKYTQRMVDSLDGVKNAAGAAHFLELRGETADAVDYYAQAELWSDAVRVGLCHGHPVTAVKTGLLTHLNGLKAQLISLKESLYKHTERLYDVRETKLQLAKEDALGLHDEDDEFDFAQDSDLYSQASSVRSRASGSSRGSRSSKRSSTRSAKSRRRNEAKKYSLKVGGVFEEEALMHELSRLSAVLESMQPGVMTAVLAAAEMDLGPLAAEVQELYKRARASAVYNNGRAWKPVAMRSTWLLDMGLTTGSVAGSEMDFLTMATEQLKSTRTGSHDRQQRQEDEVELAERPIKPRLTDQVTLAKCV
jgi:elongator complex protein 1